jgi:carboxylesterase
MTSDDACATTTGMPGLSPLPAPDAGAFALPPRGDRPRRGMALCIHGYTGTPWEVRPLADALVDAGFAAAGPLLSGHGDDPARLNATDRGRWRGDVVAAYDALAARVPDGLRVVVGCSMGALLALQLSLLRPVDALVLMAPALRFHPAGAVGVAALAAGLWRARPFLPKEGPGGDVEDADARRLNPTYKVMPTRGIVELWHLQREIEAALPRVTTPVCLLHGELDATIAPSSSERIAAAVAAPLVEHHRLARTRHLVGVDVERDRVAALALRFVDDIAARRATEVAA